MFIEIFSLCSFKFVSLTGDNAEFPKRSHQQQRWSRQRIIDGERLIRSHSPARFCFELSGNSN